jgi:hypothetical protein
MLFYIFALLHKLCYFKEKLLILIGNALGTLELILLRIFIAIVDWGYVSYLIIMFIIIATYLK